jgi:hypothetical protein
VEQLSNRRPQGTQIEALPTIVTVSFPRIEPRVRSLERTESRIVHAVEHRDPHADSSVN